jgi:hypothetical protein
VGLMFRTSIFVLKNLNQDEEAARKWFVISIITELHMRMLNEKSCGFKPPGR